MGENTGTPNANGEPNLQQGVAGGQGHEHGKTASEGSQDQTRTGQPKGPEPRTFDGHTGSSGAMGGQSAQGGATQDTMGQSGHNNSAADQVDHNIRGGGVTDRQGGT